MITKFFRTFFGYKYSWLILVILFIVFKLSIIFQEQILLSILSDILLIPIVYKIVHYLIHIQKQRNFSQIQLLIGFIIAEIIFIFISETSLYILSPTLKSLKNFVEKPDLFIGLLSTFYAFIYVSFISLILSIITILYFTRQKQKQDRYYYTMIIFLILSSICSNFNKVESLQFLSYTFGSLSIFFFIIMSYLNKWIIYLKRKEKLIVIGLSNLLLFIIIYSMISSGSKNQLEDLLSVFSNSIVQGYKLILGIAFVYSLILIVVSIFQLPTAELIERRTFEVESLQKFSQTISKVFDIDELTSFIFDTFKKIDNPKNICLVLFDDYNKLNFYHSHSQVDEAFKKFVENYISNEQLKSHSLNSATINPNYFELNQSAKIDSKKIINIPLIFNEKLLGIIFLDFPGDVIIENDDLNTIKSIAEYTSIAIQNNRFFQELIKKERIEKEFEVARDIQRRLLPQIVPQINELDISWLFIPAFDVGGDYYDYFIIDDSTVSFVIADVSGKGISAAFYMSEVKGIFESLSKISKSPKEILTIANKILCKSLDKKSFVSAVYTTIDLKSGQAKLSRSGHCPIIYMSNQEYKTLKPSGIAIGLACSKIFENNLDEITLNLKRDDFLFLYTDGVIEARNKTKNEFGEERLKKILNHSKQNNCDQIIQNIAKEISIFSQDYPQHDDITMLAIKFLGVSK